MPNLTSRRRKPSSRRPSIRCGTAAPTAGSVARALVGAEADGLTGHGLSRVAP